MFRPAWSGILKVEKNPGVIYRKLAEWPSERSSVFPSISTGQMPPPIVMGRKLM